MVAFRSSRSLKSGRLRTKKLTEKEEKPTKRSAFSIFIAQNVINPIYGKFMIWLTSDTHFGHQLMVGLRGFNNIEEHDATLISNWNQLIAKKDDVFFLGDFAFLNSDSIKAIIQQLNGNIRFCPGNHDRNLIKLAKAGYGITILEKEYEFKYNNMHMTLNHMPMYSWNRSHYGAFMLHGHTHSPNPMSIDDSKRLYDVGVDANSFKPVALDIVVQKLLEVPPPSSAG